MTVRVCSTFNLKSPCRLGVWERGVGLELRDQVRNTCHESGMVRRVLTRTEAVGQNGLRAMGEGGWGSI